MLAPLHPMVAQVFFSSDFHSPKLSRQIFIYWLLTSPGRQRTLREFGQFYEDADLNFGPGVGPIGILRSLEAGGRIKIDEGIVQVTWTEGLVSPQLLADLDSMPTPEVWSFHRSRQLLLRFVSRQNKQATRDEIYEFVRNNKLDFGKFLDAFHILDAWETVGLLHYDDESEPPRVIWNIAKPATPTKASAKEVAK